MGTALPSLPMTLNPLVTQTLSTAQIAIEIDEPSAVPPSERLSPRVTS